MIWELIFICTFEAIGCIQECKTTLMGTGYRGVTDRTTERWQCQRWDSQAPHPHNISMLWSPQELSEHKDYCRNPDGEPNGPWCYTVNPAVRWQYCPIPFCVQTTQDPVQTTQDPVQTTQEPIQTTQEPLQTTQEPIHTTQEPTTTTSLSTTTTHQCVCSCSQHKTTWLNELAQNHTYNELKELMKETLERLKKILSIDKKSTSAAIQRLISAPDSRTSSQRIGVVAVIIICIPICLMIVSDCSRIICNGK